MAPSYAWVAMDAGCAGQRKPNTTNRCCTGSRKATHGVVTPGLVLTTSMATKSALTPVKGAGPTAFQRLVDGLKSTTPRPLVGPVAQPGRSVRLA